MRWYVYTQICCCCSVPRSCPTLCDHMNRGTPGFLELAQTQVIESVMPSNHLILWHPLPSCLQSFQASGSFLISQLFTSGGQSIGVSPLASVLSVNIQDWFPLELTGLISMQSKGLSRVFSNTTVQNGQLFSDQSTLWSNSHICTWLLEKP